MAPGQTEGGPDGAGSPEEQLADVVPLAQSGNAGPGPAHRPPAFWSSFVGRAAAVDEVVFLVRSGRLVTLTGPGGMGKTRLAVEVAERVAPGKAFFVDLEPVREPAMVGEHVASAFAVGELRGRSPAEVLAVKLDGGGLLVLDNCEHLIGACAELVWGLLGGCRDLHILATSQQRLGVSGEVVWAVPPLALPDARPGVEPEAALQAAAVQLFWERASAVSRSFVATPANVEAIVEVCRRLDGNPLAIELAAARVDVLSPAQIAARLGDRFDLLRSEQPVGPVRHQTLEAALEWSYELLAEPERVLLHRLSVFAGGFDLNAAEEVCAGGVADRSRVLDSLSSLVAKSLVVADTSGPTARYRLLQTVRQYAAAALAAADEAAAIRKRHARWCVDLVEQGAQDEDEDARMDAIAAEQDNVRAALDWSLDEEHGELALRLAAGKMLVWQGSGHFAEARDYLARVLAVSEAAPAALRAVAQHDSGFAAFMLGDFEAARSHLMESLELWAQTGDAAGAERAQGLLGFVSAMGGGPSSVEDLEADLDQTRAAGDEARLAEALRKCGHIRLFRGEPVDASRHFEELVALARRSGNDGAAAHGLVSLGAAALARGDYPAAESHLREGVSLAGVLGEIHNRAVGTAELAELARLRGDDDRARAGFEECLGEADAAGALFPQAKAHLGLGRVALGEGALDAARLHFEQAAALAGQSGHAHLLAAALDGLGDVEVAVGDAASARAHYDQALAVCRDAGERAVAARSTYDLAELARAEGDLAQAAGLHHEALAQRHQIEDRAGVADSLEALAGLAAAKADLELAARLFGATEAIRRTGGFRRCPWRTGAYQADLEALRQPMPTEDLEPAWAQGASLTYEEAVAYAMRGRGSRDRPDTGPESLTPAEREVVQLVVEGLTNPEIASRLFISPRTVQSHLRNAYAKLGVSSRSDLRQALGGGA